MIKKRIEEFPDYEITTCGKIFNSKGKQIKMHSNIDGYWTFNLQKDGKGYHRRRARLLALTFIPNPDNLPVVNHIDHTRTNDNLDNLEWVTHKGNTRKSVELHPERWKALATITEELVHEVCKMIEDGYRNVDINSQLNVTNDIIKHIRRGECWTEVSCNYKMQGSMKTISPETAKWVCYRVKEGLSNSEILAISECKALTRNIIKSIRHKRSWGKISKDIL